MAVENYLQIEIETFERNRHSLVARGLGRFAVVHDTTILGIWETYEDALKAGYEKCGLDRKFLVKQIEGPVDSIRYFTRDLACPA